MLDRMNRRFLAGAMLVGAALLAACSNDGDAPEPTAGAATNEATAEPTASLAWPQVATATVVTEDLNVRTGPSREFPILGRLQPDDEVPVSGRSVEGSWLALTGIGWVTYQDDWMELSVEPRSLPAIPLDETGFEFNGPLHPLDAVVDIPVVDLVAAAVVQGDRAGLAGMVAAPATDGTAEPLGEDDSPPSFGCGDSVLPASELEDRLDEFFSSEVVADSQLHLYAVVGAPSGDEVPLFTAIFAFAGGEGRQLWIAGDGSGIEWFSLGCGPTAPGEMLRQDSSEPFFWLRPVVPEPLDPIE